MWTKKRGSRAYVAKRLLRTTTCTGTPGYQAPEMVDQKCDYGPGVDVWSLGIIVHAMLAGELPTTIPPTFETANNEWSHVSEEGKQLVTSLLKEDPRQRPTAAQALQLDWLQESKGGRRSSRGTALWNVVRAKLKVASEQQLSKNKKEQQLIGGAKSIL